MNYSTYRFTLDIQSNISQVSLPVRLNDTGRRFLINLTDGGKPYTISKGCMAKFFFKRPPDEYGNIEGDVYDCVIEDNLSTIRFDLTSSITHLPGVVDCEIRLYSPKGILITSPSFILVVDERVVYNNDIPISERQQNTIDNMIFYETQRVAAEEARVSAEEARAEQFSFATSQATIATDSANDAADKANQAADEADRAKRDADQSAYQASLVVSEAQSTVASVVESANTVIEQAQSATEQAQSAAESASEAATKAESIESILTQKLEDGEFVGEKGEPGAKGDPGDGITQRLQQKPATYPEAAIGMIYFTKDKEYEIHASNTNGKFNCKVYLNKDIPFMNTIHLALDDIPCKDNASSFVFVLKEVQYNSPMSEGDSPFYQVTYLIDGVMYHKSVTGDSSGCVMHENGHIEGAEKVFELKQIIPEVTTADNGKILQVVNGVWTAVELPSAEGVSF